MRKASSGVCKACQMLPMVMAGLMLSATARAGQGAVTNIVVADLSPAFDPSLTEYTIPRTASCSVPVTVTIANPTEHRLYIQSTETGSGATRNAWVCDGATEIDIVVYQVWTEMGRYTVTLVGDGGGDGGGGGGSGGSGSGSSESGSAGAAREPPPLPTPEPGPIPTPLPTPSPVDAATAIAFLNQATFGPTAADVASVKTNGLAYWLQQQFQTPETPIPDGLDVNQLRSQVFLNMANAPDQLRQRVMFALGQTLVISANKDVNGFELIPWVRMLSKYAFSNYRTLLRETTLSPSMGKFLDLANSRKAMEGNAPNENYARELMQLFSIGLWQLNQDGTLKIDAQGHPIPTYDQATLKEVARALTGWTYPTEAGAMPEETNWEYFVGLMEPRLALHDAGAKTIVNGVTLPPGQTVLKDTEDVVDALFTHPNTPPFVATRLIRSLVTSNPTPAYIKRVADVFADNGAGVRGDMKAVLRAVLTDPDAAVTGTHAGRLKDPVLHIIGMGRALGVEITDPNMFLYIFDYLGQLVVTPPTVFSFYSPLATLPKHPALFGPEFQLYAPALAIQRANLIYQLITGQMGSSFTLNLDPYVALAGTPVALVEKVNQTLFHGRMSADLKQIIVTATQATSDMQQRAIGALYLAAISSEYAVHSGQ